MAETPEFIDGLTISLPVSNLGKAIDWYRDVLGFTELYRMEELGWAELKTPIGNVNVGVSEVETPNPGGATPTFGVRDIEDSRSKLEAAGVRLDGDIMTIEGMVRLQTFYDPDDNALMFYEDIGDTG